MKRVRILLVLMALAGAVAVFLLIESPARSYVLFAPFVSFDAATAPPAPNYAEDTAWAALPGQPNNALQRPPGVAGRTDPAPPGMDVFFVPPTTFFGRGNWNARFDEDGLTRRLLEDGVLRHQASVFNECCRIFVPRYRQATFYAFLGRGGDEEAALDLAYRDVERAFDEFIARRNDGRPFILAGHSQGSLHGMRLLQERIAGTPLARRMVAAYLVGYSIPSDLGLPGGIAPCRAATDTHCYISWNSVAPGKGRNWRQSSIIWLDHHYQPIGGRRLTCMNPLSWQLDGSAPAEADRGSIPFGQPGAPIAAPMPHATGANCVDGVLEVTPPGDAGFNFGTFGGLYHLYDYNLFYLNLRDNLAARTAAPDIR